MPKIPKDQKPAVPATLLYPEVKVKLARGADAVTVELAKALLGWEVVNVKDRAVVSELVALCGQHVRLTRNSKNRYLTVGWLLTLRQEHLQKRWRFNGETIVISETGQVLSGQHRLLSLILAEIERLGVNADHWKEKGWDAPVTMECMIVFGIPDDDDTFKTLNQGKPGTLAEILFRSSYFAKLDRDSRKTCAGLTDRAIRLLWHRTGSDSNPFAPRRTHGEAMDFLSRHQKLLKAVQHVFEKDDKRAIGRYVDPGAAAGLLFLMASAESDLNVYAATTPPSQDGLTFSLWDKACEFWAAFAGQGALFKHLKDAIIALTDPDSEGGGSLKARLILVVKAWLRFVLNKPVTEESLVLAYEKDEDGISHLVEKVPSVGGIDLGEPAQAAAEAEDEQEDEPEQTPAATKTEAKTTPKKTASITATVPSGHAVPDKAPEEVKFATLKDELDFHRAKAKDRVLLFKRAVGYRAFDGDADVLDRVLKIGTKFESDIKHADFPTGRFEDACEKLHAAGYKLAVLERVAVDHTGRKEDRMELIDHKRAVKAAKK